MGTNSNIEVALRGNSLKESILSKTHYGLGIYSHILRLYYPDKTVLRLVKRDCGLCRNPFNSNKKTLHIWIEKTNPQKTTSKEFSRHRDSENAILAGDAFGFAELHYKQQGDELLQTLNKELNLRIGEKWSFYKNPICPKSPNESPSPLVGDLGGCLFSFFKAPISNTKPHKAVSLLQVYNAIKGNYYKDRTQKLQAISDIQQARKFKASNFDYCTFSGTFTTRSDKAIIKHSGLLCIDFDHLNSVETLFNSLLQDEYFDTQLLFRSPSGNGLKWIIPISPTSPPEGDLGGWGFSHGDYFAAVANYILQTYGVAVDKSGRDISRACFLPHDPQVFINPLLILNS